MLQPGAAHGGLPCMVARRHFTFIGGFMLLIDYDQPQIRKRCKECGTRTDHNTDLPAPRALHLVGALGRCHPRVDHRDPCSKPCAEPLHVLIRQRNLRDQHDHLFSFLQHSLHQLHIDERFAASRHTADQAGAVLSFPFLSNAVHHGLLLFVWFSRSCSSCRIRYRISPGARTADFQHALLFHHVQRICRDFQFLAHNRPWKNRLGQQRV